MQRPGEGRKHKPYFGAGSALLLDLFVTICVILVAVTFIISTISHIRDSVTVGAAATQTVGMFRSYMGAYHAIHGQWPASKEDLKAFIRKDLIAWESVKVDLKEDYGEEGFAKLEDPELSLYKSEMAKGYSIADGAIHITLGGVLEGKTLTIHPAVPEGNPTGPVRWVAGGGEVPGWQLIGEDHTTVDNKYILPRILTQ